jgi:hypothetical protein
MKTKRRATHLVRVRGWVGYPYLQLTPTRHAYEAEGDPPEQGE